VRGWWGGRAPKKTLIPRVILYDPWYKVALVTSAASGIGLATAKAFGNAGATMGLADEAAAVLWLCSPRASFVLGVALPVDGGFVAQ
jgi:NAD(P)-dependent dehydrogenase (short-subunit alcohol dehydrogenase family)